MVEVYYMGHGFRGSFQEIPPGPELDAAVAGMFLGLHVIKHQRPGGHWDQRMTMRPPEGVKVVGSTGFIDVPKYSYGVRQMGEAECMRLIGYVGDYELHSRGDGGTDCTLYFSTEPIQHGDDPFDFTKGPPIPPVKGNGYATPSDFPGWYTDVGAPTTQMGLAICRAALDLVRQMTPEEYAIHIARVRELISVR